MGTGGYGVRCFGDVAAICADIQGCTRKAWADDSGGVVQSIRRDERVCNNRHGALRKHFCARWIHHAWAHGDNRMGIGWDTRSGDGMTDQQATVTETVNHPSHYNALPIMCDHCGQPIECITVARHFPFNLGSAIKYFWRRGKKPGASELEDLRKARAYLDDEIRQLELKAGIRRIG